MKNASHRYSEAEIGAVYRAIAERRDVRHFLPDPVDPGLLVRLLAAAHLALSVGFMQPWRFLRVTDPTLRAAIHRLLVEDERRRTAEALGERGEEFLRLKVEGVRECGELLVVALMEGRERHVFGRRTLPEMDLCSVACAIQNLWLAARAEGIGVGWVSLFDPEALARLLAMPDGSRPVAILCVGHVAAFYDRPMLEQEGWAHRLPLEALVYENAWSRFSENAAMGNPDEEKRREPDVNERHRQRMARKKAVVDAKLARAGEDRGVVVVATGNGKGKSSSGFGMVARALGHGMRVGIVQFVKGRLATGEEAFFRRFPEVDYHVMGEGYTWETQDRERDIRAVRAAWDKARAMLEEASYQLVLLDELNIVLKYGYLPVQEVIAALQARPAGQHVVITGRGAKPELVAVADTVTEMRLVKHAFEAGVKAQRGIEL